MNNKITQEAYSTYEWYINSLGWLKLKLDADRYMELEKLQEQMMAILDSVQVEEV